MGRSKKLKARVKALKARLKASAQTAPAPLPAPPFPDMPVIGGAAFATARAGLTKRDRADVMLAQLAPGTTLAGCFTRSATRAPSVRDAQAKVATPGEAGAAILVNSGNANAFTGAAGAAAVQSIAAETAQWTGLPPERVITASTGVIGEPLPHERITATLDRLVDTLAPDGLANAARAIMTTDTHPKGATRQLQLGGRTVTINGIAKGSGMIAPDMATMLVYIFTDATVAQPALQTLTARGTEASFNCITVDSDTSTSDMVVVAATGAAGAPRIDDPTGADGRALGDALHAVMLDLAHQVVRDGEGATRFIEIAVTGARTGADARRVAMAIANSPLVKTAAAGGDPNWGRVVMAIGKSGAEADRDRLSIRFGPHLVAQHGQVAPSYTEQIGATYMQRRELVIGVDLRLGTGAARVWTCDLTHGYVAINADYRS